MHCQVSRTTFGAGEVSKEDLGIFLDHSIRRCSLDGSDHTGPVHDGRNYDDRRSDGHIVSARKRGFLAGILLAAQWMSQNHDLQKNDPRIESLGQRVD